MNNSYLLTSLKVGIIIFIPLAIILSLFPPFNWGSEKDSFAYFPIKQYNFLFGSNKKVFDWEAVRQEHRPQYTYGTRPRGNTLLLSRHIILSELFINYLLAFFVSIGLGLIFVRVKNRNEVKNYE